MRELKAGVSELDVKYLHNFGPQIGFNIYKLLEIAESSQGQNTSLEVVIKVCGKSFRHHIRSESVNLSYYSFLSLKVAKRPEMV